MEIEKTPLYKEVLEVIRNNDKKAHIGWNATIHLDDAGTVYTPLQVTSVSIRRDYVSGYSDEISCTCLIPLGKYSRKIYPNRNHLQITLYKAPLLENSNQMDFDSEVEAERYTAVLIEDTSSNKTDFQGTETNDEYAMDLVDLLEVNFQLFNKSLEKIRMSTLGGVFRKVKVFDFIETIVTKQATSIKVDEKRVVEGIDFIPVSNEKPIEQLVVTQGTKLIDLPDYVQKKYGIYSTGIGSFIQDKHWYIYPLYDITRFEDTQRTCTIFILPKRKFPEIERTYRKKADSLMILCTADVSFSNESQVKYIDQGNGERFTDSARVLEGYNTTQGNNTKTPRGKNNNELISEKTDTELNNTPMSKDRITSNPFNSFSKLSSRKGGLLKILWQNSNLSLVEPGMVTKIVYFDEDEIKESFGTILGAMHVCNKIGDVSSKKHMVNTQLLIFTTVPQISET